MSPVAGGASPTGRPIRSRARVEPPSGLVTDGVLAFIDLHRRDPWRGDEFEANFPARAGDLYASYRATIPEGGYYLSLRDFGMLLREEGFESDRDSGGVYYPSLFSMTREERAWESVAIEPGQGWRFPHIKLPDLRGPRLDVHLADTGHGEKDLSCFLGHERDWWTADDAAAQRAARQRALARDPMARAYYEAKYAPFVDWRRGEPDPWPGMYAREFEARRVRTLAETQEELAAVLAELVPWEERIVAARADWNDAQDFYEDREAYAAAWRAYRAVTGEKYGSTRNRLEDLRVMRDLLPQRIEALATTETFRVASRGYDNLFDSSREPSRYRMGRNRA